jgi:aminopeptidase N
MSLLNENSYQKGAWVLHMLRRRLGDTHFFNGLRSYYTTYRDSNASSDDFLRSLEKTSGQDLVPHFNQWLHRPGHPFFELEWEYDSDLKQVELEVVQIGPPFDFPLEVGIVDEKSGELQIHQLQIERQRTSFQLSAESEPDELIVDPHVSLLFEAHISHK